MDLAPYMFTTDRVNQYNPDFGFVVPDKKDTLFWCFRMLLVEYGLDQDNGNQDQDQDRKENPILEKKLKIDLVQTLRDNKSLLKQHKISSLSNIEATLVHEPVIDLKTFFALCIVARIPDPVLYVTENTYYCSGSGSEIESQIPVLKRMKVIKKKDHVHTVYGLHCSKNAQEYTNNYFKLTSLDKPLKAVTAYKLDELVDIAGRLKIDMGTEKRNKNDYYEAIVQTLS
jgi:hypothetical protein